MGTGIGSLRRNLGNGSRGVLSNLDPRMSMNTVSAIRTAAKFGCTVEQAQRQLDKNVAQLTAMRDRARATGKKVNNYTAEQLDAAIVRLTASAT